MDYVIEHFREYILFQSIQVFSVMGINFPSLLFCPGESDDDREDLVAAAQFASSANGTLHPLLICF